ncbi:magnesium transporter CorA family protein [Peteryoungia desertarenae]|uniref:Magnesium transporter CorA family protein n=1 Tax=Peteryoungia desertarenae TaxID=1813451 RepID=A0ABX6QRS8_9HYPH|nr:magnesium transporter CorA family protein [Peteryoungia desertarenae]QLF71331.1 magnesium transporter CorA family protein [Peteryoungia desertarenae]
MIRAYRANGSLEIVELSERPTDLDADIIWLDLIHPTRDEAILVEELLSLALPTRDELKDIEPSSRLYVENEAIFMTASLIYKVEADLPHLADIAFILFGNRLITIRYAEPKAFAAFSSSLLRPNFHCASAALLLGRLLEAVVDRTAEVLEMLATRLDELSVAVFIDRKAAKRRPPGFLEDKLLDIAAHHQLVSKASSSLVSLGRMAAFLQAQPKVRLDQDAREMYELVGRDIQSLDEHAAFVGNNISFMLDASLGLISVEQNAIIKIFSIASVVFLPPTLVASIYGMNFKFMPELEWSTGYPLALVAMLLSAVIPFLFFRWKGWL